MHTCDRNRSLRRIPAVATGLLCVAAFLAPPPAEAGDAEPVGPPVAWERYSFDGGADVFPQGRAGRFYNEHLIPRMNRGFARYGGVWLTREAPGTVNPDVVFDVWSEAAERQAERATRRAVTDYLLEETSLSRVLARVSRRRHLSGALGVQPGNQRAAAARWDVGIAHGLPRFDLTTSVGVRSTVRFSLRGDGRLGVELRPGPQTRTRLSAIWLFDERECRVGANFAF